ncbi:MAG: PepSY domain-containing protein [Gammaproteobacteria bacterium]
MRTRFSFAVTLAASAFAWGLVLATEPTKPTAAPTTEAKIERGVAEKTALARVPGGQIKEGELEHEHGHLVWSFDISQATTPNITEVQVDAITGKIVSVTTETPADQAKEAAADRAKMQKKP